MRHKGILAGALPLAVSIALLALFAAVSSTVLAAPPGIEACGALIMKGDELFDQAREKDAREAYLAAFKIELKTYVRCQAADRIILTFAGRGGIAQGDLASWSKAHRLGPKERALLQLSLAEWFYRAKRFGEAVTSLGDLVKAKTPVGKAARELDRRCAEVEEREPVKVTEITIAGPVKIGRGPLPKNPDRALNPPGPIGTGKSIRTPVVPTVVIPTLLPRLPTAEKKRPGAAGVEVPELALGVKGLAAPRKAPEQDPRVRTDMTVSVAKATNPRLSRPTTQPLAEVEQAKVASILGELATVERVGELVDIGLAPHASPQVAMRRDPVPGARPMHTHAGGNLASSRNGLGGVQRPGVVVDGMQPAKTRRDRTGGSPATASQPLRVALVRGVPRPGVDVDGMRPAEARREHAGEASAATPGQAPATLDVPRSPHIAGANDVAVPSTVSQLQTRGSGDARAKSRAIIYAELLAFAQDLLRKGKTKEARRAYAAALNAEPAEQLDTRASGGLVSTFASNAGELGDEYEKWIEEHVRSAGKRTKLTLAVGEYHYRQRAYAKAMVVLDDLAEQKTALGQKASLVVALCLLARGDRAAAGAKLDAVARNPMTAALGAKALLLVGWSHMQAQDYAKARACFERLVAKYPKSPFAPKASTLIRRLASFGKR